MRVLDELARAAEADVTWTREHDTYHWQKVRAEDRRALLAEISAQLVRDLTPRVRPGGEVQ